MRARNIFPIIQDVTAVEAFLITATKQEIDRGNIQDQTPLLVAAKLNLIAVVRLLIAAGADVNKPSIMGDTPLYAATMSGNEKVVELLLEAGADTKRSTADRGSEHALYAASIINQANIVSMLLAAGADVNERLNAGETALYGAACVNRIEIAKLLIKAGCNLEIKTGTKTALDIAIDRDHQGIVKLLLEAGAVITNSAHPVIIEVQRKMRVENLLGQLQHEPSSRLFGFPRDIVNEIVLRVFDSRRI